MPLPRTVLTAPGVRRPGPAQAPAGAFAGLTERWMHQLPRAVCFPRHDDAFAARVQTLLDGSHAEGPFAAAVQALLRETHPLAVIHPRDELAAIDGERVWYAFRDGSAVSHVDREDS